MDPLTRRGTNDSRALTGAWRSADTGIGSFSIISMRPSLSLGALLLVLLSVSATAASRVHGVVADQSNGVLPGVTVVATAEGGGVLATGITDAVGRYALGPLPAAPIRLTFQLEGFSVTTIDLTVAPDADALIGTQRMKLAPKSETVVVRGDARATAPVPPPAPRVAAPPSPRPVLRAVPPHDKDSICGPAKAGVKPESFGTIRSGRSVRGSGLFGEGDELSIEGGTATGLEVGQNLVARRAYRTSADAAGAAGEHTAGLLQIVAAGERTSVATVIYACDELARGDWLAPFRPEPIRTPEPAGVPAYDRAARILLTDDGQLIGAPRRLMVIDRGLDNGFRVGQRLTLFRPARPGARGPAIVGDAVVVAVREDSATIRVQRATDVIVLGDSAAPQR